MSGVTKELLWDRFMRFVETTPVCWKWIGATEGPGYGLFSKHSKSERAYRISYELFIGPIPKGMTVHHICHNPNCVNPGHLELLIRKDHVALHDTNIMTANSKKTHCRNGHEYTEKNTRRDKNGGRYCRECHRIGERNRQRVIRCAST
jgi:hypothetical protein